MRRTLAAALLVCAALSAAAGQPGGQRPAKADRVAEEIKRIERAWLVESYRSDTMADYDRFVADDFTITHSNGRLLGKAEKRADILASRNPNPDPASVFRIEDASVRVRVFDDDVAVSTGYIVEKYAYQGRNVDDHVHFTNTYLKRRGHWQVVASQLTRARQQQ